MNGATIAKVSVEDGRSQFISTLTQDEKGILKAQLSNQINSFFDENNELRFTQESNESNFNALCTFIRLLTKNHNKIPDNGIAYLGFPEWLNEDLLASLQKEALERRSGPVMREDHLLGCGGEVADALSVSKTLIDFMTEHIGTVVPTGIASYLFYDRAGSGIRPHIDTEVFAINLIIMLRHDFNSKIPSSATVVFPPNQSPQEYRLEIGQVMIMYGSSTIHTRSIVDKDETVHLLTIGFNF